MSSPNKNSQKPKTEIATLGEHELFVARSEQGLGRVYWKPVTMTEGRHYNKIAGKYVINSEGYIKANQFANLSILSPDTIIMDGLEKPNPCIERDSEGCTTAVHVRRAVFGFSPTGNPVIIHKSLTFDLKTYLIQDLQSRIKRFPACGTVGVKGEKPKSWKAVIEKYTSGKKTYVDGAEIKPSENANLRFIPTAKLGDDVIGIWYDLSHPEVQAMLNEANRRRQFADRIATTFCERNALKAHPAIATVTIPEDKVDDKSKTATVLVFGYKHDLTLGKMRELHEAAAAEDINRMEEITGKQMEIVPDEGPAEIPFEDGTSGEVQQTIDELTAEEAAEEKAKKKPGQQREVQEPTQAPPEEPPVPSDDGYIPPGKKAPAVQKQSSSDNKPPEKPQHIKDLDDIAEAITAECKDSSGNPIDGKQRVNDIANRMFGATDYSILESHHAKKVLEQAETIHKNLKARSL